MPTPSVATKPLASNPPASNNTEAGDIWIADVEPGPKSRAAPPKKPSKKRKSGNKSDLTYKASAEPEDDAEWEAASTPKKKRATAKTTAKSSPKGKKKRDPVPASSAFATRTTSLQAQIFEDPEPAPQSSPARASLELTTVEEETTVMTTITTIAINDVPKKPTAFATPSHPSKHRARSRSREPSKDGRGRSVSPPPGNGYLNGQIEEEDVVELVPDGGEVPPLPTMPQGLELVREEFEWPDDVF